MRRRTEQAAPGASVVAWGAILLASGALLLPQVANAQSYLVHNLLDWNNSFGGSPAPIPGEKYSGIGGLRAGDDDVWVNVGTTPSNHFLAMRFTGASEELLLAPGDPAPGLAGEFVTNTNALLSNRSGVAYLEAGLASGGAAHYRVDGTTFSLFDPLLDPAPAPLPGALVARTARCMDDSGGIYFIARYDDAGAVTTALVHQTGPGDPATLVFAEGDPAPDTGGTFGDFFSQTFNCGVSESGHLAFPVEIVGVPGVSIGVFWRSADGSTAAKVIAEGDPRPDGGTFSAWIQWAQLTDRAIGVNDNGGDSSRRGHAASFNAAGVPCCVRELGPVGSPAPPGTPGGGTIGWAYAPYAGLRDEMVFSGGTVSSSGTPLRLDWALFFDRPDHVGLVASANTPVVGGLRQPDSFLTDYAAGSTGHVWFNGFYDQDSGGLFWAQRVPQVPSLGHPGLVVLSVLVGVIVLAARRDRDGCVRRPGSRSRG